MHIGFAHQFGISGGDLAEFYDKNWQRKMAISDADFCTWQFLQPPNNDGKNYACVSVDKDNNILGVLGLYVCPFINLAGKEYRAAELTTWVVASESRGLGIGTKMLSFLKEEFDVLSVAGVSDAARAVFLNNNFQYVAIFPRFFKIWNYCKIKPYISTDFKFTENIISSRIPILKTVYNYEEVKCSELHDIFKSVPYSGFIKDKENLLWRFDNHPVFDYYGFRIYDYGFDADDKSTVILRHVYLPDGFHLVHILECVGSEKGLHAAISFIDDYCKDNNVDAVDFSSTNHITGQLLRRYGWWSIMDEPFMQLTNRWHPPELNIPASIALMYHAPLEAISSIYACSITTSDMDPDRPTYEILKGL